MKCFQLDSRCYFLYVPNAKSLFDVTIICLNNGIPLLTLQDNSLHNTHVKRWKCFPKIVLFHNYIYTCIYKDILFICPSLDGTYHIVMAFVSVHRSVSFSCILLTTLILLSLWLSNFASWYFLGRRCVAYIK